MILTKQGNFNSRWKILNQVFPPFTVQAVSSLKLFLGHHQETMETMGNWRDAWAEYLHLHVPHSWGQRLFKFLLHLWRGTSINEKEARALLNETKFELAKSSKLLILLVNLVRYYFSLDFLLYVNDCWKTTTQKRRKNEINWLMFYFIVFNTNLRNYILILE